MSSPKKSVIKASIIKKIILCFLFLAFGVVCLAIGVVCLFLYNISTKNPYNHPITEPQYEEVYVGNPHNIKTHPNGILAFTDYSTKPPKIFVIQTQTAQIISHQNLPEISNAKLYVTGPYWRDRSTVIFPVLGENFSGECFQMYVASTPSWKFTKEFCDTQFIEEYKDGQSSMVPNPELTASFPKGTDTRGQGSDMWGLEGDPVYSPQKDLIAFQVSDRYHGRWTEGNWYIDDVRLVDNKGCFIAQIGSKKRSGRPTVILIGWTKQGGLLVHRQGWLKNRELGIFLIRNSEIQKMKDLSGCYK